MVGTSFVSGRTLRKDQSIKSTSSGSINAKESFGFKSVNRNGSINKFRDNDNPNSLVDENKFQKSFKQKFRKECLSLDNRNDLLLNRNNLLNKHNETDLD